MPLLNLTAPVLINAQHRVDSFDCGENSLNDWLKRRALKNQHSDASRCFVVCEDTKVVGYYSLSAGGIAQETTPKAMRRNMPDPMPVILLGRLAIDKQYHNQGIGQALLRDAMLRSVAHAEGMGIFAILVHALSDDAKQFYLSRGFVQSPIQPMTLLMTLATVRSILLEN
jgi:GNAT superfamily N-acetyltransferase